MTPEQQIAVSKSRAPGDKTVSKFLSAAAAATSGKTVLIFCANNRACRRRQKDCIRVLRSFGIGFHYKKNPDFIRVEPGGGRIWFAGSDNQATGVDADVIFHDTPRNKGRRGRKKHRQNRPLRELS